MDYKRGKDNIKQHVNYVGNNIKSMHLSVNASLKKLRTDYIDILYVHWWDWDTSVEEVMDGLHNLVVQGKVLYLVKYSISFFPPCKSLIVYFQGNFGYSRLDRRSSKSICEVQPKDTVRDLPRCLESPRAFI